MRSRFFRFLGLAALVIGICRRRGWLRAGARPDQPRASDGPVEALLRRRQPERSVRRPRVLHGRPDHRRALRRRPGLLALSVGRIARPHQVGDPGERPHRPPHLRAHSEQRPPRLAVDQRRAGRRRVQHRRATSTSSATTTRRPASSSTSSSRTRRIAPGTSASTFASTGRQNLVTDAYDFDQFAAGHRAWTASSTIRSPTTTRTRATRTPPCTARRTGTSTSRPRSSRPPRRCRLRSVPWSSALSSGGRRTSPAIPPRSRSACRSRRSWTTTTSPRTGTATRWTRSGGSPRTATDTTATTASSTRTGTDTPPGTTSGRRATSPARSARSTSGAMPTETSRTTEVDSAGSYVLDPTSGLPIPDPAGQPFTLSAVGQDVHRDLDHDGTEDECEFKNSSGRRRQPGFAMRRGQEQVRHPALRSDHEDDAALLRSHVGAGPLRDDGAGAQLVEHRGEARGAARQGGRGDPGQRRRGADVARLPDERGGPSRRSAERDHRPGHLRPLPQPGDRGRQRCVRVLPAWPFVSAIFATASSTSSRTRRTRRRGG